MAETDFTNIAAASIATPAAGVTALFVDNADKKIKTKDDAGVISTLNNDGLQDRNIVVNGGFAIQQRVATASTAIPSVSTTTRAGQVADRWAVTVGNVTTPSWAQIDTSAANETGLLARYYGKITQATNAAKFILSQFVINTEMMPLRGQKVRVSCKIKQFVGSNANYRLGLLQLAAAGTVDTSPAFISAIGAANVEPTWGTNLLAINPDATPAAENGTISGAALTIASTAAWVRSSCVFTVPTDAKNLVVVLYRDTLGAASDAVGIAEFQMTQGPDLVDYKAPPLAEEMLRCQRFFYKTFTYATVPVTNAGVTTGCVKWGAGVAGAVAGTWSTHPFATEMFKIPTITLFNPGAANAQVRQIGATAGDCSVSSGTEVTTHSTGFTTTPGATAVIGTILGVHFTADAEFVA